MIRLTHPMAAHGGMIDPGTLLTLDTDVEQRMIENGLAEAFLVVPSDAAPAVEPSKTDADEHDETDAAETNAEPDGNDAVHTDETAGELSVEATPAPAHKTKSKK